MRAVVSQHSELLGEAYGKEQGRSIFINIAAKLGIKEGVASSIFAEVQSKTKELGIEVKELL